MKFRLFINRAVFRHQLFCLSRDCRGLTRDFIGWSSFFAGYIKDKFIFFGRVFENRKGVIVNLLMAKRGRYSRPFLNLSMFVIVGTGFVAAPIIKENHPLLGGNGASAEFTAPSAVLTSISAEQVSTSTEISDKPRDRVINYRVQGGDTLSTIAEKFGVSADTIRWANDYKVKNPVIRPGDEIKIPPVTGVVHTVKKGETIYSISKKYKAEPQGVVDFPFNDFQDLETFQLAVGQSLIIPEGVVGVAEPVRRAVPVAPQIIAEGSGQFLWPAGGRITQYFVWYHKGLDIANKSGPGIAAADAGTVTYAGCLKWGYGCHVRVSHGNGYETLYAHLTRYYVSVGQTVGRGEALGQMGCTGRCTGTHLHFEVRKGGGLVNPLTFLQ
jgi:murein DD-endopeptidase MepM/ murein hydrolase activator NlpD